MASRLKLIVVAAAILVAPFTIRAANRLALDELPSPGYLPSLEIRVQRHPFNPSTSNTFATGRRDGFSSATPWSARASIRDISRKIASTHAQRVHMLIAPATGPAWWFLAFKNWVVASGVKPRCTFVFFRDTNLTDTMFRLESQSGNTLDMAAHETEAELDRLVTARRRGPWARV